MRGVRLSEIGRRRRGRRQRKLELPVRIGIATGEAEPRGDYFGTVLNRTARVMAAGHGGRSARRPTASLVSGATSST